jgi:hypothetical protein
MIRLPRRRVGGRVGAHPRRAEIPVERFDIAGAARLYPSFAFVLLEPEAGVIRAERSMRALAAQAVSHGARIVRGRASPDGAAAVLDDSTRLAGDVVVWACGPWLPKLFPALVSLRVTQQELLFLDGGPAWRAARIPAWCDYERSRYGTADVDDAGVKAAIDDEGLPLDPDADLPSTSRTETDVRAYLRDRFPAGGSAPHQSAVVSIRTHGRHPTHCCAASRTRASGLSAEDPATVSSTARRWPSAWRPRSPRGPRCRPTSLLGNGRALRVCARPALVTHPEPQRPAADELDLLRSTVRCCWIRFAATR